MEGPLPQVLLDHGQFVRAVARRLLHDEHRAADLAQEAWARYLEHPPKGGQLHGWFRRVLRNLSTNLGRGERRRVVREERAARPESLPSTAEELEHADLLRGVVDAVLGLDEPYRTTILMRYYRGLDAAGVAKACRTTPATVRSREHRALEKLRERLDRSHGDRTWALALARLVGEPSAETVGWSPVASVAGVLAAVGLALVAVRWIRGPAGGDGHALQAPATTSAAAEPGSSTGSAGMLATPAELAVERAAVPPASGLKAMSATPAEIRGRLVLPGGSPAVGASLRLEGWGANHERQVLHGQPDDWTDLAGTSDDEGRFSLRFDPPRAFQFVLEAKATGHAEAAWRWIEIPPGARLDLGEVELPVGGTVEGRIVDDAGRPVPGPGWTVYLHTVGLGEADGRDETRVRAAVDPVTGAYRAEDVWPVRVAIHAESTMTQRVSGPTVVVASGATTTADLVHSGPDDARRITVTTSSEPFHVMDTPEAAHVRLVGPDGESHMGRWSPDAPQTFSFEGLGPGPYAVEIDDPRYERWSRAAVVPGETVHARLDGPSALRLGVVDSEGRAVERYSVRVAFRNVSFSPREWDVHDGRAPLEGGRLAGIFPGDYEVVVTGPDGAVGSAEVDGLRAGETRSVALRLMPASIVAGRVVHPDGAPVRGALLTLLLPAKVDDSKASPILHPGRSTFEEDRYRRSVRSVESDASGSFLLPADGPGAYHVLAEHGSTEECSDRIEIGAGEPARELVLVLARPGAVRGRVLAPKGAGCKGLRVWIAAEVLFSEGHSDAPGPRAMVETLQRHEKLRRSLQHHTAELDTDGRFELTNLPPGPSRVFLVVGGASKNALTFSDNRLAGSLELGALVVPPGGMLEQDFQTLEFPGSVVLTVLVNGQPAPWVEVVLRGEEDAAQRDLVGRTDASGRFGPEHALPGAWRAWVMDLEAGWMSQATSIFVEPARETRTEVAIVVASAALVLVDADGRPLAEEWVTVTDSSERAPRFPVAVRRADADGRVELALVPGEYALQRGRFDPRAPSASTLSVPLSWTASGPLETRVRF